MRVTNGEIVLMREALQKLIDLRIPASLAFKLAKLTNKVNERFQDIELTRVSLVKQYGVANGDGNTSLECASQEDKTKFWEEYVSVLNQEVEIDSDKISLPEELEVEAMALMPLEKFIEVG